MARAARSLTGQVVAITGGARGIGRATAAALIAQGAQIAIGDIDASLAERTAQELGAGTVGLPLDVTNRASFEAFLDEVESRVGPLDVLINNAGIMPIGPFTEESDATAVRMVGINLHGVIFGSKLALKRFQSRGRGHLVNIASAAGKTGFPGGATYCATKHAVVGLSESIRQEVRGTDIGVSVVMPVVVHTELGSGLPEARGFKPVEPEDVAVEAHPLPPAHRRSRLDRQPRAHLAGKHLLAILGRLGFEQLHAGHRHDAHPRALPGERLPGLQRRRDLGAGHGSLLKVRSAE